MRKAKYTDEDIIAAGKLLESEVNEVTANSIKLKLGGGNHSRIKKVWDAHEATDPQESLLKKTPDPDEDRFAMEVSWPIQGAFRSVESVFEKLLADISERAEGRIEKLLDREEQRHRNAEAELQGQLKVTERQVERKEEERYGMLQKLIAAQKKIESLEVTIESMEKQIDELKEKESS